MQKKPTMPLNADTINTLIDAMGAITLCVSRQLTPEQRTGLKNDLTRLAADAGKQGNTGLEMLLTDMRNVALD
jgi:hypothetical protein